MKLPSSTKLLYCIRCDDTHSGLIRTGYWWKESDYLALEVGTNIKGVWVNPVPHLIIGQVREWAQITGVEPVRIPGYWLEKPGAAIPVGARAQTGEKVLYALRGGGYAACSAHPDDMTSNIDRKSVV